ncbi:centromere protein C-like [Dendronephthya gigantea]|uniref:centromere protein C-like n=1 Tax=Dendronephthya gigantea TaxID=151771 RepID=UPI00106C9714|nr:centromere protein C-like [Dendronephthya gigantea]
MATKSRRSLSGLHNKPYIGRRTGKVIEVNARLDKFGFEHVSDYFPDTDSESENETTEHHEHIQENNNQSAINKSVKNPLNKQVSSPATESEKVSVSPSDKQISLPKSPDLSTDKRVPSTGKPVSPSNNQVLSTVQRINSMPPASINCSNIMIPSSPEENVIPGSTRKKLRFSLGNTSILCEEERLDIQHSLISPNQQNDPVEEEYTVTDHVKESRSKKASNNKEERSNSRESSENVEELLTQEVCKRSGTFLTLKKPKNTLKGILSRSTGNATVDDTHEEPKTSSHSASKNPETSRGEKAVQVQKSKVSPEIEVVSTTSSQSTKKATRSRIPVRRKKGVKLTFQVRSRRKSSPKTKSPEDQTSAKTQYRKTPGAKKGQRKTTAGHVETEDAETGDAENDNADGQGNDADAKSSIEDSVDTESVTIEKSSESQQKAHTTVPRSKRVTRSSKRVDGGQEEELGVEQTLEPSEKKTTSKTQTKARTVSKVPISTRTGKIRNIAIANQDAQDAPNEFNMDTTEESKIPVSLRKTNSNQGKATKTAKQIQDSDDILENGLDADLPIILDDDRSLRLKDDATKHPASSRSLRNTAKTQSRHASQNQKTSDSNSILESEENLSITPHKQTAQKKQKNARSNENPLMSKTRNTRSRKANETTLEEENKESTINKSTSKVTAAEKQGGNTRSSTKNASKISPNVSRDSLENESESECEESNTVDHLANSSVASSPRRSYLTRSSNDSISNNAGDDSLNVTGTKSRASRKRKSENSNSEVVEKKPAKMTGKQGTTAKTAKSNTKSRGGYKSKTNQGAIQNSGFSSDDEATTSCKGNNVSNDTVGSPISMSSPETDDNPSTIKARRNKNKRTLKIDSIAAENDNTQISETDEGLRRSQRNRVPCLQYWKNDRIEYERRQSGWVVKNIIVNPTPAPTRRKRRAVYRSSKYRSKRANRFRSTSEDESDSSDMEIPDGMTEEMDAMATVVDADTLEDVQMKVLHNNENLDFRSPTSNRDGKDAPLLLHKYFSQKKFGAGEIILKPGAEKGRQHVRRNIMIFHILSGNILFSIHNQNFTVTKGSTFFVPQGNMYNLKNLSRKRDARLIFSQIKE